MFLTGAASAALLVSSTTMPATAATTQRLAVAVVGPGAVTSTPAGISCPAHCTATFPTGSSVLLTAKPANGAKFVRWGGSSGRRNVSRKTDLLARVCRHAVRGRPRPSAAPLDDVRSHARELHRAR